jgi:hypothetical protein
VQTQKDHVHAYTFLMGRMSTALVAGEISGPEVPGRRARRGFVIGAALAVLILIGFFVYGLIVHERAESAAAEQAARPQPVAPAPTETGPGGSGSRDAVFRIAAVATPPAGFREEG